MFHVPSTDIAASTEGRIAFDLAAVLAPKPFQIVPETGALVSAREALLDRAMGPGRTRKASEAIRRGRAPASGLAFAAVGPDGSLLATLRLWHIAAGSREGADVPALLLGPLAVDPAAQGLGLGSAMMRHAIFEARRQDHGAIVLVGDPDYYARFGFAAAATAKLTMPGPFEPRRLLARELRSGAITGAAGMICGTGTVLVANDVTVGSGAFAA